MKKEQVLDLMNAVPPDLIEEAGIAPPVRRRIPKTLRTGLIAACLCLALLGTAAAAVIQRMSVQITNSAGDANYTFLDIQMTKYPLSAFSPALNAASANRNSPVVFDLHFDTWDEVQAFLGEDIPCVWPRDWDGTFQMILYHTESKVLWGVAIYSTDLVRQAEIHVEIRTELWQYEHAQVSGGYPEGELENLPEYAMANGADAILLQYTGTERSPSQTFACFVQNGILYNVTSFSPVPPLNDTVAQLHAILDSFPASR